ncbi:MAG: group III truncated hemoglobin [Chitinophagales bacterium]|nr:group III truncated hemoglobin [Chitinophagales bacterium]
MNDIETRQDIELLVNTFYEKVKQDDTIGFIFHTIIGEDWSHHLPIMYQFWSTILFGEEGYKGNPIRTHIELDKKITLKKPHYERWVTLWNDTVNDLYKGKTADEAMKKAKLMIDLIEMKVNASRDGRSIL